MPALPTRYCLFIAISTFLTCSSAWAAGGLTVNAVKNARAQVPSMGQGSGQWVQFKNGAALKTKAVPFAEMKTIAVGITGKTPCAVTHITWNTGGSGYWNTLILFKESNGKLAQVGRFNDYVGSTDKLEIKENRIFVHLTDQESVDAFSGDASVKKEGKGWISLAPSAFTR